MNYDLKTQNKIYADRPLLKKIMDDFGDLSLLEYGKSLLSAIKNTANHRKNELIETIKQITSDRIGKEASESVGRQLQEVFLASTADHHAIMNSNLSAGTNYLVNYIYRNFNDHKINHTVVISCAGISLNNEDFPRGLVFHTINNKEISEHRLSILPSNSHNSAVYNFRAYTPLEIKKIKDVLQEKTGKQQIEKIITEKINYLIDNCLASKEIFEKKYFTEQITAANNNLWPTIFGKNLSVIYIEQEELTAKLLIEQHLQNANSPIYKLIFNDKYDKLLSELSTQMEKFLRQNQLPTYLFWHLSKDKNYRNKIHKEDKKLIAENGWEVDNTPEAITGALRDKELMPNLFLIYLVIHLYYGLNCLGGFNQIHYLSALKKIYLKSGIDSDCPESISDLYLFGFNLFKFSESDIIPSAIDLYLHDTLKEQLQESLGTRLRDIFQQNIPVISKILHI